MTDEKKNVLEWIRQAFWIASSKARRDDVSKHAAGRTPKADAKAKRRARNRQARAMRKVQRRRDRQSSKRQRS